MRFMWLLGLLAFITGGCSIHRFDEREVPVITVGEGLRPQISWTPPDAFELNMYEGEEDGDGFGVLWTAQNGRRLCQYAVVAGRLRHAAGWL